MLPGQDLNLVPQILIQMTYQWATMPPLKKKENLIKTVWGRNHLGITCPSTESNYYLNLRSSDISYFFLHFWLQQAILFGTIFKNSTQTYC